MRVKDLTNKIIIDHGDLIIEDLSSACSKIFYTAASDEFFFKKDGNMFILEFTDIEKKYMYSLFEKYGKEEKSGVILEASYLNKMDI